MKSSLKECINSKYNSNDVSLVDEIDMEANIIKDFIGFTNQLDGIENAFKELYNFYEDVEPIEDGFNFDFDLELEQDWQ